MNIYVSNLVTIVPSDAWPSADTVLTTKLERPFVIIFSIVLLVINGFKKVFIEQTTLFAVVNKIWHDIMACPQELTHWPMGDVNIIFKMWFSSTFHWSMLWVFVLNCLPVNAMEPHWTEVNIGSDNGLVPQASSHYLNQCWPRTKMP